MPRAGLGAAGTLEKQGLMQAYRTTQNFLLARPRLPSTIPGRLSALALTSFYAQTVAALIAWL